MGQLQRISSTDLRAFDRLEHALDRAFDLADVVRVRDAAEVYRIAASKAKRGLEVQNRAAELRLRAERKAGTKLSELKRSRGGRPAKNSVHRGPSFKEAIDGIVKPPTAKRWQRIAEIDQKVFERFIRNTKASIKTSKPLELT